MTFQSGGLIEILHVLGATVRSATCNIFSKQGHACGGSAKAGTATVLAWRGAPGVLTGGAEVKCVRCQARADATSSMTRTET